MQKAMKTATVLYDGFRLAPDFPGLDEEIRACIEELRYSLIKWKYGSEHPALALTLVHMLARKKATARVGESWAR